MLEPAARVDDGLPSPTIPVRTSHPKPNEFQIEVGDFEKHLLVGKLFVQSEMMLTVYGITGSGPLRFHKEADLEVYEGDVGVREKLFLRVQRKPGIWPRSPSQVCVSINGRLVQSFQIRPKRTAHYVVFQRVLPCLFLMTVAYYSFIYKPEVAHFYTGLFSTPQNPHKAPIRQHGFPTQQGRNQQVASLDSLTHPA